MESLAEGQKKKDDDFDDLFRFLIVGDSGTGKSSLLLRFVDDTFSPSFEATIGIDFKVKTVTLENGRRIKLQIWDTAGQERFRTITNAYYRSKQAILVVYDVTNKASFDNVPNWMTEVAERCTGTPLRVLVGTKRDLVNGRAVGDMEARTLATQHGYDFVETSAKTDSKGVHALFAGLAERVDAAQKEKEKKEDETVRLHQEKDGTLATEKKKCC